MSVRRNLCLTLQIFLLTCNPSYAGSKKADDQTTKAFLKQEGEGFFKKHLTVEDIYSDPPITGRLPSSIRWLPNSKGISFFEKTTADSTEQTLLRIAKVPSGERKTVCIVDTITVPEDLKKEDDEVFTMSSYRWAKTADRIAFSFKGDIFTLKPIDSTAERVTHTEATEKNYSFSPDGKYIAFSRENDLFTINLQNGEEIRLTSTGCDTILNGVLDWVYMEELFTRGNTFAYWWSPDSRRIAFLEFNESPVPEFPLVSFSSTHGSVQMQRYPKAGDPNPLVRVGVYDFETSEITWCDSIGGGDTYIARVHWLEDSRRLAIETLNRDQTELKLVSVDATSGDTKEILTERDSTWVNITDTKHFYEKKPRFVWSSEQDGFSHLYLYKLNGDLLRQLVKGLWTVSNLNGVDEENGWIYFTALEKSVLERHLYRVSARGRKFRRISKENGTHSVRMSPDCRYYIDTFSNAKAPPVMTVHSADGRKRFTLGGSQTNFLDTFFLPEREFYTFTSSENITYCCSMIKPPGFDPAKKYPVIIYVYGGPHAQVVRDSWGGTRYLWHAMMASRGYIIFSMDNRGSYGRGKEWEDAIARRAGILELHDQLAGVEHLRSLPFVDPTRIGIWGWSYGGFMTCTALLRAPDIFKAGVSVAPVTDWRLYDTIYTERYMDKPEDNEEGYDETSLLELADSLKASLLLVHGTADNNVHMQNTIQLVQKLIQAGKDFDLMLYPGKRHGIRGRIERMHLFNKITKFFEENL